MPRGPAPQYTRRQEPIMDDYIWASINHAGGNYDPDTGHYAHLVYSGIQSRARAEQIEDALYRCGRYMHRKKIADIGIKCYIKPAGNGTWNVEYFAVNKAHTYKYLVERYGTDGELDRSKLPYDPRKRAVKE